MTLNAIQESPTTIKRDEAAIILRVSTRTVDRLISDGELPASKVGRSVRINRSDVLALLTSPSASAAFDAGVEGVSLSAETGSN